MLRISQKPLTGYITLVLVLMVRHTAFSQGDSCVDPSDITGNLPVNGSHSFTVDTADGDKFYSFTAPEDGTFEISSCSNPSYLVVYNDACEIQHEQAMSSCFSAVFAEEMIAGETVIFEFDGRNNVAGLETTNVTAYFQEDLAGESALDPIEADEGTNTVTRYLGNQYFVYETTKLGRLTIKTCQDGNAVDGTDIKLYDNSSLETLLVDNTWCSNDPDGDLAQSIIEYQVETIGLFLIIKLEKVPFWYATYDFEIEFELAGASCDNLIPTTSGNTYNIDHAPAPDPYQSEFWYSYTADADGQLTITNCDLIPGITKVTVFDGCGGTNLGVADGNCNGGAELTISMTAGESVRYKWDDSNEPDWNIEDYAYSFNVMFETAGSSCENPIAISDLGIYDVDNFNGDQWFEFTAPETTEIAITTGPASQEWGYVNLANGQDTRVSVYDGCGGNVVAFSDDAANLGFGRSYATLDVTAGATYLIQWEDRFVNSPFQYQFELFKVEEAYAGETEGAAVAVDVGVHRALIHYKNEHWFKYTFPSDGVLVAVNLDEQVSRVIPSYQMLYGDNGLDLELPYVDEFSVVNWSDDEPTETNFIYEGVAGEEVLMRVENVGGIYLNNAGNRDFELAFFAGAVLDDLCYYESELTAGVHQINSADGDQKYKFTATVAGNHIFSADDDPSILIKVYDQCFDDPLYSKYNNFYYEKEMVVGEELYFVFLDEYGGACDFEIIAPLECIGCNEWLGANANWADAGNWSFGTVPSGVDNVLITATPNDPVLIGDAEVFDLYLDHSTTLTIESGASLLIQGTVEGTGEAVIRRNTVGDAGYSIIGSPVQNEEVNDLNADFIYAFDGLDYVVPSGQLNVGEGYFTGFNAAAPFVEFRGTPNHGDISKPLTQDGVFQLLSNPYTAALDYSTFVFENLETIGTSIYLWDDGGLNEGTIRGGGYVTVSTVGVTGNSGTKGPGIWTGSIPTSQGFYVFVEQPGTVSFNTLQLFGAPGSNGDGGFYRIAEETKKIRLSLSGDDYEDDLLIGFREDASAEFDLGLDARKRRNNHLSFFSIADELELAIQALKWEADIAIPLGYHLHEAGSYSISVSESELIDEDVELILLDTYSDRHYDLREGAVSLALEEGEDLNRFELLVSATVLSVEGLDAIAILPSLESLLILYPSDGEEQVLISTLGGKVLFNEKIPFRNGQAIIDQQFREDMVYLVRVGNQTFKFLINK